MTKSLVDHWDHSFLVNISLISFIMSSQWPSCKLARGELVSQMVETTVINSGTQRLSPPRHHSDHSGTHRPLINTFKHIYLRLQTSLMSLNLVIIALYWYWYVPHKLAWHQWMLTIFINAKKRKVWWWWFNINIEKWLATNFFWINLKRIRKCWLQIILMHCDWDPGMCHCSHNKPILQQ